MAIVWQEIFKLLLAALAGGLIGAEREFRHRAAGFRTIIFISVGAALFTLISLELGGDISPVRIAAHVVTGVGFLCAGVVLEHGARVIGLTTASTIWLTAAIGMGFGGGQYALASAALVITLVVLWIFPSMEEKIYNMRARRTYQIALPAERFQLQELEDDFRGCGLDIKGHRLEKTDGDLVYKIEAAGSPACHEKLIEKLVRNEDIHSFEY